MWARRSKFKKVGWGSLNVKIKMFWGIFECFTRLTHQFSTWDQGRHREHHFCFWPRFTSVNWGGDGQLHTSIYDKRDDFNFHITNFPFLSSNIPYSPAYRVFISQLIQNARACSSYERFILRTNRLFSKLLILRTIRLFSKLLKQGYLVERLKSSFRKFYCRHGDLI